MSHFLFLGTRGEKPARLNSTRTWLVVLVLAALLFLLPTHSVSATAPGPNGPTQPEGASPVGDAPEGVSAGCATQTWVNPFDGSAILVNMLKW